MSGIPVAVREVDRWVAGASALRRVVYRIVEQNGETELQVKTLDAPDEAFTVAERGHRVAQEVARLLLEEKKVLNMRTRAAR